MPVDTINFTTGPATLPDVGTLFYNGCTFSPLFYTSVYGNAIKDNANRTVKYMEYTITADGYVTLPDGVVDISTTMKILRNLLEAQGGALAYKGRGCDIVVNGPDNVKDVAWGPIPKMLEFQPLGGGRSAKIRWQIEVRIPEIRNQNIRVAGLANVSLLQFNYDTSVIYNEDGYSTLSVKGTAEIPLTRTPNQTTRTLTTTVDDIRSILDSRIFVGIDLRRFRVTQRNYSVSTDKRILQWNVQAEEYPYMGLPPDCTIARGTYSFRPVTVGVGLAQWFCTLRATYTVRKGAPRRTAWWAFLALLRERMRFSVLGIGSIPGDQNPPQPIPPGPVDCAIL